MPVVVVKECVRAALRGSDSAFGAPGAPEGACAARAVAPRATANAAARGREIFFMWGRLGMGGLAAAAIAYAADFVVRHGFVSVRVPGADFKSGDSPASARALLG